MEGEQHPVEAAILVDGCSRRDVVAVDDRARAGDRLRGVEISDVTDEFDWHESLHVALIQMPSASRPAPTRTVSSCGLWMRPQSTSR